VTEKFGAASNLDFGIGVVSINPKRERRIDPSYVSGYLYASNGLWRQVQFPVTLRVVFADGVQETRKIWSTPALSPIMTFI